MKRVLIIAGSDSGGGAGIQADIKTVTALGAFASTAVTAVTVQDTRKVHAVHEIPADIIREQINVVLGDIGADCIKIGMIGTLKAGRAIASSLSAAAGIPIVVDPVLVATSGDRLGDGDMPDFIRDELVPLASIVTPNLEELAALTGADVSTGGGIEEAAQELLRLGAGAVLAKGGHAGGPIVTDRLITDDGITQFEHPRIETTSTHGTGCSLASAVAAGLAQGLALEAAVSRAIAAVERALEEAPGLGRGHGPLNHVAMGAFRRD